MWNGHRHFHSFDKRIQTGNQVRHQNLSKVDKETSKRKVFGVFFCHDINESGIHRVFGVNGFN